MDIGVEWVTRSDAAGLRRALGRRKLILASASPRRATVLRQCRVPFVVSPVEVGEKIVPGHSPSGHVIHWSRQKAKAAGITWRRGTILGADTVVVCDGRILGKPADRADARRLLQTLSGRTHTVYTGLALLKMPEKILIHGWQRTKVTFNRLTDREIWQYIASGEPMDKAGAYGIQGAGQRLVAKIDGPLDNVVGLPVGKLATVLERLQGRKR